MKYEKRGGRIYLVEEPEKIEKSDLPKEEKPIKDEPKKKKAQ